MQFVHYSLLLLEPGGKHVPFGHRVVPGTGKPAFHVHEGLNFCVWASVLFNDYLMIIRDRTLILHTIKYNLITGYTTYRATKQH